MLERIKATQTTCHPLFISANAKPCRQAEANKGSSVWQTSLANQAQMVSCGICNWQHLPSSTLELLDPPAQFE